MESRISFEPLTNGEGVALGVIEITSIPHISIIDPRAKDDDIVERYKNEMNGLLTEVHQIYKDVSVKDQVYKDIALELLWTTHEVKNQPYNAEIKLFIIVRSIDTNEEKAKGLISSLLRVFKTTLHSQRYEIKESSYDDISPIISNVNDNSIAAIVKDEKVSNLQNAALPYCYSFDKISSSNNFSKIVGSLIDYPIVQYMLTNRKYIGEFRYNDIVIPDAVPAIVSKDLFERVQRRMAQNKHAPARHKAEDDYLLTTNVVCANGQRKSKTKFSKQSKFNVIYALVSL